MFFYNLVSSKRVTSHYDVWAAKRPRQSSERFRAFKGALRALHLVRARKCSYSSCIQSLCAHDHRSTHPWLLCRVAELCLTVPCPLADQIHQRWWSRSESNLAECAPRSNLCWSFVRDTAIKLRSHWAYELPEYSHRKALIKLSHRIYLLEVFPHICSYQ